MKLRLFVLFILTFTTLALNAQTVKVTGIIKDEQEKSVEFANVILTAGNTDKINGTLSKENGTFELQAVSNNYKLTVSTLGYET